MEIKKGTTREDVIAFALSKPWSHQQAEVIAGHTHPQDGSEGCDYKTAVRKMRAAENSAPTVKNISGGSADDKKRAKKADAANAKDKQQKDAEAAANRLGKFLGEFADAHRKYVKAFQSLKEKMTDPQLREDVQTVRDFFAVRTTPKRLLFGKYDSAQAWCRHELDKDWDYLLNCIREAQANLRKAQDVELTAVSRVETLFLTEGEIAGGKKPPKPPKSGGEKLEAAANLLLGIGGSNLPEETKQALGSKFSQPTPKSTSKEIDTESLDNADVTATAVRPSHAIRTADTALIVDLYGGTRVSIRDVDHSLFTPEVILDILESVVRVTTSRLSREDRHIVLAGHSITVEDLLNNNGTKTIDQVSNPTEETVTA